MADLLAAFGVFVPNQDEQYVGCLVVMIWVGPQDVIEGIDVLLFVFDDERLAVLELKDKENKF